MPGVLVLVEQHHPIAVSQVLAHLRERRRQASGGAHLRAEVHQLRRAHALGQRVEQRHQLRAFVLGGQQPQQPLAGAALALIRARGQVVNQPLQLQMGVAQLVGVHQVLGELTPQPQHHRRDRGRRLAGAQFAVIAVDDIEGQLPQLGLAEQPGVGFDGQQQAVVTQQRAGEGMVGADHGAVGRFDECRAGGAGCAQAGAGQPRQPGTHPAQQLTRRLAGERQSQHLTGFGVAVGDQPDHSCGHRFGFARTGARNDDQRARRRSDDRGLLLGGRDKP